MRHSILLFALIFFFSCTRYDYDVIIENGTIYDGSGAPGIQADVAIKDDRIVHIGIIDPELTARTRIDATGKAVTPGFINMLSWGANNLLRDGRSMSDIKQGVTLVLFGEGTSMGPYNAEEIARRQSRAAETGGPVWRTLGEFLYLLEHQGVSTNVGSFVGASTIRRYTLGEDNIEPTAEQLHEMRELVREAMLEGAMGLGSALIYTPGVFASTYELASLSEVVAEYDGMYTSHIRSEGDRFEEAVQEVIDIAEMSGVRAHIHHLKAAGEYNWHKLDNVIAMVEGARERGLDITSSMYNYTAAATSFTAIMPPWSREGGNEAWFERLRDPETRARIVNEIKTVTGDFENFYLMAGSPENIITTGFRNPDLRHYTGRTLGSIAEERGTDPVETAIDLILEDESIVGVVYFLMSEENVKRQIALPWMTFGSDSGTMAAEGEALNRNPHPRAYGNFARLLGKYVRDEQVIPLEEAIHKLTGMAAENLRITERGFLREGYFADVVVFDPATVQDHATFENPHQYATGVYHVFVNGGHVIRDGGHTRATPGRFVKGPGAAHNAPAASR
ncbi:MAG: D-aminoacylase [Balneolales bacterium]|nr:D-aminoacylase [Balneolales bacterium]